MSRTSILFLVFLVSVPVRYGNAWQEPTDKANRQPTAADIIQTYLDAVGSDLARQNVKSIRLEATSNSTMKDAAWTVEYSWQPNQWRTRFVSEQVQFSMGQFRGRMWDVSEAGVAVWYDSPAASLNRSYDLNPLRLGQWLRHADKFSVLGMEPVDGAPAWQLEFRESNSARFQLFFDTETGLLVRSIHRAGDNRSVSRTFKDYRQVDELMVPYRVETVWDEGANSFTWEISSAVVNSSQSAKADFCHTN